MTRVMVRALMSWAGVGKTGRSASVSVSLYHCTVLGLEPRVLWSLKNSCTASAMSIGATLLPCDWQTSYPDGVGRDEENSVLDCGGDSRT